MAPRRTYAEIATALNRAGLRSAFGRRFTSQHVGYICRRDGLGGHPSSERNDTPEAGFGAREKLTTSARIELPPQETGCKATRHR
jgi:hypothetical protein